MNEFDRFKLLIGEKSFNIIKNKRILIVGVGGVGGYVLETLARSGIENITIIDNDIIDITNLNRQIISLNNNVGSNKVDVAKERILKINSKANIKPIQAFLNKDNISILGKLKFDYIVDCCDTIETKILLIKYCLKNNIKIISSMGAGKRLDATQVCISRLDKTFNDPLAKVIRKRLNKEHISLKIPVVFSKETPLNIKSDVIASCSYIPATFGLFITNYIINDIIKDYQNDNLNI